MGKVFSWLTAVPMHRLTLYYLAGLVVVAWVLSLLALLPYPPGDIVFAAGYLLVVGAIANKIFSRMYRVPVNVESTAITALILALIIGPLPPLSAWPLLTFVGVAAMASKYLLTINHRHLFNPAAFGVAASALLLGQGASWWVGTVALAPFVLLGGLLVLKQVGRSGTVAAFWLTYLVFFLASIDQVILNSPIIFFSLVMLVEPLTSPALQKEQIVFGAAVAIMILLYQKLFTDVYYSLELALLTGNLFFAVVNPSFRRVFKLRKKQWLSQEIAAFFFEPSDRFNFKPGQFLHWALPHPRPDSRGIRRYFTIASSPVEGLVMLVTKFSPQSSTFKLALRELKPGETILGAGLAGDFVLPADKERKLVFIAGGVGITPFRSMVQYLLDEGETRDVVLLFLNRLESEILFKKLFTQARKNGLRTVYLNTRQSGRLTVEVLKKAVPDWQVRLFYVSGSESMVEAVGRTLDSLGLPAQQIKKDHFPGY